VDWTQVRRRANRLVLRHRRALAACLVGIAAINIFGALAPGPGAQRSVVVATKNIMAGQILTATSLRTVKWPTRLVGTDWPDTVEVLVGRTSTGAIAIGEPVTATRVIGRTKLVQPTGTVLVPVRIADAATITLVNPGDLVDVVAAWPAGQTGPANATTVASRVRIVTIPRPASGSLGSAVDGALLVVAVPTSTAIRLAAAAVSARLSIALLAQ
jgi:pilus assembly protein CpaB